MTTSSTSAGSAEENVGKPPTSRWTPNPYQQPPAPVAGATMDEESRRLLFHQGLPGYEVTPLVDLPQIAADLGLARVAVKDESSRLGLPVFKMLGASWAAYRVLSAIHGEPSEPTIEGLRAAIPTDSDLTLVTATDGNHGRAVARMASYLGLKAIVLIPDVVSEAAIDAVRQEGAEVRVLDVDYDQTVREAARLAEESADLLLIQDTSWPGYETVPQWIVDGYATLFEEITSQVEGTNSLLLVPAGVGSLAQAAAHHCQRNKGWRAVTVEPESAPCIAASLAAGQPITVKTGTTSMAGLNCGTPSSLAFPTLLATLSGSIWVNDDEADRASADLGREGIDSGPCGAASLAGLRLLRTSTGADLLDELHNVILLNTEATR